MKITVYINHRQNIMTKILKPAEYYDKELEASFQSVTGCCQSS